MAHIRRQPSAAHSAEPPAIDVTSISPLEHTVDPDKDAARAANETQLIEERKVNPLWMITVALAVLFMFGALLMPA